jgi:hypothetical protein
MYLKKYDLDMISDEKAKKLLELSTNNPPELVGIYNNRTDGSIAVRSLTPSFKLVIVDSGNMFISYNGRFAVILNAPAVHNLLLETQWIDPKVELPKDAETDDDNINYVIKLKNGIMKAEYHSPIFYVYDKNDNETLYNKNEIIGWLSAENVVM